MIIIGESYKYQSMISPSKIAAFVGAWQREKTVRFK